MKPIQKNKKALKKEKKENKKRNREMRWRRLEQEALTRAQKRMGIENSSDTPNTKRLRQSGRLAAQHRHAYDHYSPFDGDGERSGSVSYIPLQSGRPFSIKYDYSPSGTQLSQQVTTRLPASAQNSFPATSSDYCQNCNVNIEEIERTTAFRFPSTCPICHQPRSNLPANVQNHQATRLPHQQFTPTPSFSRSLRAQRDVVPRSFSGASSEVSPEKRLLPSRRSRSPFRTTPTERRVQPTQRYRPVYSSGPAPYHTRRGSPSMGISMRWEHDKYERVAGHTPYRKRQTPQPLEKRIKKEVSEDEQISGIPRHDRVIGLDVDQLLAEERLKGVMGHGEAVCSVEQSLTEVKVKGEVGWGEQVGLVTA